MGSSGAADASLLFSVAPLFGFGLGFKVPGGAPFRSSAAVEAIAVCLPPSRLTAKVLQSLANDSRLG